MSRLALAMLLVSVASAASAQQPAPVPGGTPAPASSPSWLGIRGELRERVEGVDGAGFVRDQRDMYYLTRVRLNATAAVTRRLAFQAQVQDARVAKKTLRPTGAPFRAPVDLRMAFAAIGAATDRVSARVGRQELAYGEQRLIGPSNWSNTARTFDAARLTIRLSAWNIDAFGGSLVRVLESAADRSGAGNGLAGVYATAANLVPSASVEPYMFWRRSERVPAESGTIGALTQTTIGARVAGRLPARLDYAADIAVQRGSLATDRLGAWAGHWQLRESLPGRKAVRLTGEYNYASGDENPADGVRGTFDQMYPTAHGRYGMADQVGWRNIHHLHAGFDITPVKSTPMALHYHSWWLADAHDGLYNASGPRVAFVANGASSRHVGQELDVEVSRALTPQLGLAAGYAHIFSGPFLKQATPGASYSYPYIMATYTFAAGERRP